MIWERKVKFLLPRHFTFHSQSVYTYRDCGQALWTMEYHHVVRTDYMTLDNEACNKEE